MKTFLVLAVALALSAPVYAKPPPRPLYRERVRPLVVEPVMACKPFFAPLCRLVKAGGGK